VFELLAVRDLGDLDSSVLTHLPAGNLQSPAPQADPRPEASHRQSAMGIMVQCRRTANNRLERSQKTYFPSGRSFRSLHQPRWPISSLLISSSEFQGLEIGLKRKAWPFLLGVVPWESRTSDRERLWLEKKSVLSPCALACHPF
jgi:hypothetical protein